MSRHYIGKTYEMTQDNWNKLLRELEEMTALAKELREALSAMIAAAKDNNCGLRIADEALAKADGVLK